MDGKSFITLTPSVNVIKNYLLQTTRPNKLECLYLSITFLSSPIFVGSPRSLPKKEASERSSNWVGSGLALKFKDMTGEGVKIKHTSLLGLIISEKEKGFITLTPGGNLIKPFFFVAYDPVKIS